MIEKQVIFFPKTILETNGTPIELLGYTELMKNGRYYFILPSNVKNVKSEYQLQHIGHFTRTECRPCLEKKVPNALCISELNGTLNASLLPEKPDNFVLVIYDSSRLYDYDTSLDYESDSQKLICFKMLSKWLSNTSETQELNRTSEVIVFQKFSKYFLLVLNVLINSFEIKIVQLTILRLTLFKHILGVIKNYAWLVENFLHNKQISKAKAVNYLMSCICDAFFGITVLYLLNITFTSSNELFSFISNISHVN